MVGDGAFDVEVLALVDFVDVDEVGDGVWEVVVTALDDVAEVVEGGAARATICKERFSFVRIERFL